MTRATVVTKATPPKSHSGDEINDANDERNRGRETNNASVKNNSGDENNDAKVEKIRARNTTIEDDGGHEGHTTSEIEILESIRARFLDFQDVQLLVTSTAAVQREARLHVRRAILERLCLWKMGESPGDDFWGAASEDWLMPTEAGIISGSRQWEATINANVLHFLEPWKASIQGVTNSQQRCSETSLGTCVLAPSSMAKSVERGAQDLSSGP